MYPFIKLTDNKLKAILRKYSNKNIFIVHGKKSYELSGAKKIFSTVFSSLGCIIQEHYDFQENPKWDEILPAIQDFNSFNPDLIIAVGGGSVIDTAKLIRFFSCNEGSPESYNKKTAKELIPFFVFPTTSGTGSEATHFAVCYVKGEKYSVASQTILPTKVFIDFRFTLTNSAYLTASTGMDALAQAIEAYWSIKSTIESRIYAKKAIKYLYTNLPKCISNNTSNSRKKITKGSYYAGKAINISFTTGPHAYSYPITSLFGIPHGHAVAVTLPSFFVINEEVTDNNCNDKRGTSFVKNRMNELKDMLGISKKTDCKKHLKDYVNKIFSEDKIVTITDDQWSTISSYVNQERLANNPVKITFLSNPCKI